MATEPTILTTGLLSHVENLRRILFRLVMVFLLTSLAAYPFAQHLLHFVKQPLAATLVMYAPLEGFLGYVKVSLATGFVLTAPLLLYEVKRFLQVVCRLRPRQALLGTVATAGLFLLGVSFCYVVILPVTLNFLLSYGGDNIAAGIAVSKYLSLTLGLAAICGAIFELPLVTLVLYWLDVLARFHQPCLPHPKPPLCGDAERGGHGDPHPDSRRVYHEHAAGSAAGSL
jgi:sec-independent protein translocase protein TatC